MLYNVVLVSAVLLSFKLKILLEEGMAAQSSILAWRIPWTVQSMVSQSQKGLSDFHFCFSNRSIFLYSTVLVSVVQQTD